MGIQRDGGFCKPQYTAYESFVKNVTPTTFFERIALYFVKSTKEADRTTNVVTASKKFRGKTFVVDQFQGFGGGWSCRHEINYI